MKEDVISYLLTCIVILAVVIAVALLIIKHNQPTFVHAPHITPTIAPASPANATNRGTSTMSPSPSATSNTNVIPFIPSTTPFPVTTTTSIPTQTQNKK